MEKDLEDEFIEVCNKNNSFFNESIDLINSKLKEIKELSEKIGVPINFRLLDVDFNYTPKSFNFYLMDYSDCTEFASEKLNENCYKLNIPNSKIGWNTFRHNFYKIED